MGPIIKPECLSKVLFPCFQAHDTCFPIVAAGTYEGKTDASASGRTLSGVFKMPKSFGTMPRPTAVHTIDATIPNIKLE